MERIFNIDDTIEIPKKLVKKHFAEKIIILAPKFPNWIVLNEDELKLFELLTEKTISNSLELYCTENNKPESDAIYTMQLLLNKIERSSFYEYTKTKSEPPIEEIKKNIQINLTSECNLKCKHCYISTAGNDNSLDHIKIKEVIVELTKIIGTTDIVFSGGEPLMHPEIEYLLNFSKVLGHNVILFTNGTIINNKNINFISKNVNEIQLSMEGVSKDKFEEIRGKNTYTRFLNSLGLIKNHDLNLTLAVTSIDSVINDIEINLIDFLKTYNYRKLNIRISGELEKSGNSLKFPHNFFIANAKRKKKINSIINSVRRSGFTYKEGKQRNIHFSNCGIGSSIVINSNGKIYPCNNFSVEFGDIYDNLENKIKSFNEINRRTSIKHMDHCKDCELLYICNGGCRIKNFISTGSYLTPNCDDKFKDEKYLDLLIDYYKGE